ncbi:MAG: polysulfide reductase NrfD [Deltaproteobacteria bacterium]|nr:polysulfide reductase NrfD [Deltaproteobacteria bacterium]
MAGAQRSIMSWKSALVAVAVIGGLFILARFAFGIGAIANINNAYPWGWWVGFGVLSFIAFGGCGFTIALLVDILGQHRFAPLVRPAITMGLLLYLGYVVILMIELGRPWMGWIIFFSWQPTSALFEVAWCATLYTTVLAIEFGTVAAGHYRWQRTARLLGLIYLPAVVIGVSLSHLHQSSLGTLLTIVPLKVDPRWWSELLPATFLVSSYMAGLSLVTIEHVLATRFLRLKPRVDLLGGLACFQIGLIVIFLTLRIGSLVFVGATDAALTFDWLSVLLWTELIVGYLIPLALFSVPDIRQNKWALFGGSCLLAGGILLTRLNTAVFGMQVRHWESYFPSFGEYATTFGVLAALVLVYGVVVRHLPIHREEPLDEDPAPEIAPSGVKAVG